ncbi:sigma-54-dependent Fis family transcriptional regulator, partial [Xanthomonas sp. Kuri4-3]
FLDEIGNLSPAGQMKLLRVLETGRFERLGSNRERQVRVRVISATNADLTAMIRDGSFREDLYYRLNTVELALPPLAERPGDILPLAEHFLEAGRPLSAQARSALQRHAWPGNVRELRNQAERFVLGLKTAPGQNAPDRPLPLNQAVEAYERGLIGEELRRQHGNISRAAEALQIAKTTLFDKIRKYGIDERG